MRDVVNISGTYDTSVRSRSQVYRKSNGELYPWSAWTNPSPKYVSHPIKLSGRSEIIQSDNVRPTAYEAYRYSHQPARSLKSTTVSEDANFIRYGEYEGETYVPLTQNLFVGTSTTGRIAIPPWVRVRDICENKVLSNIRDQKVNLAQTVGELPFGAGQMVEQVKSLWLAYLSYERGDWAGLARHLGVQRPLDTALDAWLAWKFGWKPLIQDIYNMRSALTASLESDHHFEVGATVVRDIPFGQYLSDVQRTGTAIAGCTHKLYYRVADNELAELNNLGLTDPLALGWELLPYSFVVDWFSSVGDFLYGLSAPLGLDYQYGYRTEFVRTNFTYMRPDHTGSPGKVSQFAFKRDVLLTSPQPSIVTNFGLNRNKIMTLIAMFKPR